jgi:hypothetical protein
MGFLNLSRITSFEAVFENVVNIDNNYYHLKGVIKPGDETSFEIIPIVTSDADTINGYSLKITTEKTSGTADNVITFVVEG